MSNDASQPEAKRRNYKSVFDAGARIVREEGASAFYRGSQPFVMRAMLVGGTQVATYDQFKELYGSVGEGNTEGGGGLCEHGIARFICWV
jgi:solute carrier family 25 oxoglutarate transporter 11